MQNNVNSAIQQQEQIVFMEQHIKQLIDGFTEPTLLSDSSTHKIVTANKAAVKNLGYGLKTLKTVTFQELFEPYLHGESSSSILYIKGRSYRVIEDRITTDKHTYYRHILRPLKPIISPDLLLVAREMAKVLIHRVRSPLTGITGFFEMIDKEKAEEAGIDLDAIDLGFDEIRSILDKLENFTLSTDPNPVNIDLSGLIKDLVQALPRKHKKRIHVKTEDGIPNLQTDFVMLQSILSELLKNATEHTEGELDEIIIETYKEGRIRITNFGKPIPKSLTRRIFIPFITTKARHLGLGLPRALLIAERLDGKVYMTGNSAIDGIQFEVSLPVRTV